MQPRRLEGAKKKITGFVLAALLAVAAVTSLAELRTVSAATAVRDLAAATPESVGVSAQRLRRIDDAMKKAVDEKRTAGVVTLLTRHGKVVHHNAVGVKDVRKSDPVQKDSIFRIYSMTKPITGAAMMMLYEEGKWRLDDPVSRHIPEFAKLQVLTGTNPDGSPTTEPARRQMTMRELMTHTAGLGYVLNSNNPVDRMIIQGRVLDTAAPLQTMIDKLGKLPLMAQPGTRWSYSIAVDVQGYLVEKFSGHEVRRVPADAPLRAARHEGHGVLRAAGEAVAPRAGAHRREGRRTRGGREPAGSESRFRSARQAAAGCSRRRWTTRASSRCC